MPLNQRSEWWDHFHQGNQKFGNDKTHWKAFCHRCMDALVREIEDQELQQTFTSNGFFQPRSKPVITQEDTSVHLRPQGRCANCIQYKTEELGGQSGHATGGENGRVEQGEWLTGFGLSYRRALCSWSVEFYVKCSEHPFFRKFFKRWLPEAFIPSRKVLSGRILDEEAQRVTREMQRNVIGRYATGQCDGWKNITRDSLVVSTINVEYTPWLLNVFNISAAAKTAQNLLEIVVAEIKYCMEYLSTVVVGYCTDAGGDTKAMRELLRQQFPWIITVDCWAHQMNLLVGDYFKHMRHYAGYMDQAEEIIKWFNNHTRALAMLAEEQRHRYDGRVLALLYPVVTRWSSHYLTCARLLEIEHAMRCLLLAKLEDLVNLTTRGRNTEDTARKKDKTREILSAALLPEFWDALHSLYKHLAPFSIATNIAQADNTRLDTILLTLGKLACIFSDPVEIDPRTRTTILTLLEDRWKKVGDNREIFILALLFNPYVRRDCFNSANPALTVASLWRIFKRVFRRMMQREPDVQVMRAFSDYLARVGQWSDESMMLQDWRKQAVYEAGTNRSCYVRQGTSIDLVAIWRRFETTDATGEQAMVTFAARLLSIVPNTGATERIFSKMGAVHTKYRSRLRTQRVRKTVMIKDHLLRTHPQPRKPHHRHPSVAESDSDPESSEDELPATPGSRAASSEPSTSSAPVDSSTGSISTGLPSFSALVDDAIAAAAQECAGPSTAPMYPASDRTLGINTGDELSLQRIFNFTSDSFLRATSELWAIGMRTLESERAILETQVCNTPLDATTTAAPASASAAVDTPSAAQDTTNASTSEPMYSL
ncbi:ribonuclease H-like domain-containing protein [Trametes elegans]|nr:ribonuclease H-like domain-containing protein [Trametes elegans]